MDEEKKEEEEEARRVATFRGSSGQEGSFSEQCSQELGCCVT